MPHEFKETRRIEFVDTDLGGVVHFSNFFRFMEATEHSFYRSLGLGIHMQDGAGRVGFPRVSATCEYLAPLRFDEEVEIHLKVREKGTKSVSYEFVFRKVGDGKQIEVARGSMTAVSVSFGAGGFKSIPIPRSSPTRSKWLQNKNENYELR